MKSNQSDCLPLTQASRLGSSFPALGSPGRRQWLQLAGAGAVLHCLAACGNDNDDTPDANRLNGAIQWGRDSIQHALQTTGATAVSVALMTSEGVIWQEAFGLADTQSGQAATINTRFNIGSVSKVLAALAAMILCDQGKLNLDTPITRYLPDFAMLSDDYRQITLRHLLSHSSGLPGTNWRNIFTFAPIPGYAEDTLAGMAEFHTKHAPGLLAVYCNDGFTLVENLVAAVAGVSYPEFVKREILQPLGMTHSAFPEKPFAEGSFVHPVYEGRRMGQEFVMAYATGGLASTPGDMMKLASLFLNQGTYLGKRIVSQASVQQMGADQTTQLLINPSPEWRWGLGWDSVRQPGLDAMGIRAWQKNGGTSFFTTDFFVLPEQGMALLVTGAGTNYGPGAIAEGVLLRALDATNQITSVPGPVAKTGPAAGSASGNATALEGIYGNYSAPIKVVALDARTVDLLHWQNGAWASLAHGLTLRSDGWWWSDAIPDISYRWQTVEGRHYVIQRVPGGTGHYRLTMPLAQRLTPSSTPLSAAWQARAGTRWQPLDESPDSVALQLGDGIVSLDVLPDLPGYVLWSGSQLLKPEGNIRARMTVQVPVNHGRDLVEVVVRTINGEEQLRVGTSRYRLLQS